MPVAVSMTKFGPLWSIDLLDLVWIPSFRSSVAIFADWPVFSSRVRSRYCCCDIEIVVATWLLW